MDATTAVVLTSFLFKILRSFPGEIQNKIFESFLPSFSFNALYIHRSMQFATTAIATPYYSDRAHGITQLYNGHAHVKSPNLDVFQTLATFLVEHFLEAVQHSSTRMRASAQTALHGYLIKMTRDAIMTTSEVRLRPNVQNLSAMPALIKPYTLVSVDILAWIGENAYRPDPRVQGTLDWFAQNMQGLANHAPSLRKLRIRLMFKSIYRDDDKVFTANGVSVSMNEKLVDLVHAMRLVPAPRMLRAKYKAATPDMDRERIEMEAIVAETGRATHESVVNTQEGIVEAMF